MPIHERLGILAFGLGSCLLTALANVLVEKMIGLSLFSFSLWLVVPVGAIGMGFLAAGGFYLGALYFNRRLQVTELVLMTLFAAATMLLIYYWGYSTFVLNNGEKVSDLVPFLTYLDVVLTKAHYKVGRGQADTGEVGQLGYWLAVIQFLGFMIGGVSVYLILKARLMCAECQKYYRVLKKKLLQFSNTDDYGVFFDDLQKHAPGDDTYSSLIFRETAKTKVEKGAVNLNLTLYSCPQCKQQYVEELTQVCNGSEWKDVPAVTRKILVPKGLSLVTAFDKKEH